MGKEKRTSAESNKISLNKQLIELFNDGYLYTVDQLSELTGFDKKKVRTQISLMKSEKYCSKKTGPIDLVQDFGFYDGKKRWGLRGSKKIFEG